jgi:SAM-dependent methyltransferase
MTALKIGIISAAFASIPYCAVEAFAFSSRHCSFASQRQYTFSSGRNSNKKEQCSRQDSPTLLKMGLDPVTYLRTEFVTAALFTNQTPRSADVCVQLGSTDGRAVSFIPRTIRQFIPSSVEADGKLDLKIQRAIKLGAERRDNDMKVMYCTQRADDLKDVEDNSVDVVLSMQAAEKMVENGLDWKKSILEAGRVLKPGGRFLFVEQTELEGENYLDYVLSIDLPPVGADALKPLKQEDEDEDEDRLTLFESLGWDDVDLVLTPHVAGVVVKREDAGLTKKERAMAAKQREQDIYAERSLQAFERGIKRKKKKKAKEETNSA